MCDWEVWLLIALGSVNNTILGIHVEHWSTIESNVKLSISMIDVELLCCCLTYVCSVLPNMEHM